MKLGKEENRKTEDSERIDQGRATKNTRDTKTEQGRDGKEENWETMTRIDQGILAREIRETTRKEIRA